VVDDDQSVLRALSRLLTAKGYIVRTFSSALEFLATHDFDVPGCAVVDVSLPGLNGLELQAALKDPGGIARPIIFISGLGDVPTSVRAMKEGAVDFLTKPIDENSLFQAIGAAVEQDCADRRSRRKLDDALADYRSLTLREREVLAHVAAGRLNKQIAGDLGISEKTIKLHRGRMMAKMKARSVAELVRLADRLQLELPQGR
jgi:FixJ family two-component response regulator